MTRSIKLPNGAHVTVAAYVLAWKRLRSTPSCILTTQTIDNWAHFPTEASRVLADMRDGLHDRINRHARNPRSGRKWSDIYQTGLLRDRRRINDYAQNRIVHPVNQLETPELQRRFKWRYSHEGFDITLHSSRS